tara:strand:+ start:1203 stop:1826 length:624 start_codon:yes stop_codon:yes gene_type:complete
MNQNLDLFSNQLQFYRERKKISKSNLGNLIGKSASYIRLLERHQYRPPTYDICQQLSLILELSPLEKESFLRAAFIERLGNNIEFYNELNSNCHSLENFKNELTMVSIANQKKKIIYVNDTFCKVTGFKKEEAIGETHAIINSGHHSTLFFKTLHDTIRSGNIFKATIKNKSKNQTIFTTNMEIVPMKAKCGDIEKYIGIQKIIKTA